MILTASLDHMEAVTIIQDLDSPKITKFFPGNGGRYNKEDIRKISVYVDDALSGIEAKESSFSLKLNDDAIVFWPPNSFKKMHKDGTIQKKNEWVSLCYLNDDYEGGETMIESDLIKPKKGRLVVFPSKKMSHGVSLVKRIPRYTYIAWWQEGII